jgi:hypothetical protein
MNRTCYFAVLALALAASTGSDVCAQNPLPRPYPYTSGPAVSPYLNLLRPGNGPAINYYGLVRPQFDTLAGFQAVQQRFGQLQTSVQAAGGPADGALITGHGAAFMNLGGYFMTTNVGSGVAPTAGAGRPAGPGRTLPSATLPSGRGPVR